MGRLYDHFCDAVCDHLFHGLGYVVDPDIVPFQKFCHDHFTGPGTVNLIIREMFSDALFNHIDGLLQVSGKLVPKLTTRIAFLVLDIRFCSFHQ